MFTQSVAEVPKKRKYTKRKTTVTDEELEIICSGNNISLSHGSHKKKSYTKELKNKTTQENSQRLKPTEKPESIVPDHLYESADKSPEASLLGSKRLFSKSNFSSSSNTSEENINPSVDRNRTKKERTERGLKHNTFNTYNTFHNYINYPLSNYHSHQTTPITSDINRNNTDTTQYHNNNITNIQDNIERLTSTNRSQSRSKNELPLNEVKPYKRKRKNTTTESLTEKKSNEEGHKRKYSKRITKSSQKENTDLISFSPYGALAAVPVSNSNSNDVTNTGVPNNLNNQTFDRPTAYSLTSNPHLPGLSHLNQGNISAYNSLSADSRITNLFSESFIRGINNLQDRDNQGFLVNSLKGSFSSCFSDEGAFSSLKRRLKEENWLEQKLKQEKQDKERTDKAELSNDTPEKIEKGEMGVTEEGMNREKASESEEAKTEDEKQGPVPHTTKTGDSLGDFSLPEQLSSYLVKPLVKLENSSSKKNEL